MVTLEPGSLSPHYIMHLAPTNRRGAFMVGIPNAFLKPCQYNLRRETDYEISILDYRETDSDSEDTEAWSESDSEDEGESSLDSEDEDESSLDSEDEDDEHPDGGKWE